MHHTCREQGRQKPTAAQAAPSAGCREPTQHAAAAWAHVALRDLRPIPVSLSSTAGSAWFRQPTSFLARPKQRDDLRSDTHSTDRRMLRPCLSPTLTLEQIVEQTCKLLLKVENSCVWAILSSFFATLLLVSLINAQ